MPELLDTPLLEAPPPSSMPSSLRNFLIVMALLSVVVAFPVRWLNSSVQGYYYLVFWLILLWGIGGIVWAMKQPQTNTGYRYWSPWVFGVLGIVSSVTSLFFPSYWVSIAEWQELFVLGFFSIAAYHWQQHSTQPTLAKGALRLLEVYWAQWGWLQIIYWIGPIYWLYDFRFLAFVTLPITLALLSLPIQHFKHLRTYRGLDRLRTLCLWLSLYLILVSMGVYGWELVQGMFSLRTESIALLSSFQEQFRGNHLRAVGLAGYVLFLVLSIPDLSSE